MEESFMETEPHAEVERKGRLICVIREYECGVCAGEPNKMQLCNVCHGSGRIYESDL